MKVKDLIEKLKSLDQEKEIKIRCGLGCEDTDDYEQIDINFPTLTEDYYLLN